MKVIHCNFSSVKPGFRDNEVFCKPDMTSSWFGSQGALHAIFHDGFWKSDHNFLIVFHSNFVSEMLGFWDNMVLLQAGYDVIMISSPRGASDDYSGRIWKSDHDFLIVFHSNFLSVMHGFRNNEVSLQAGYDVIVISTLGVASGKFSRRNLKERPWLFDRVLYQLFV